MELRPNNLPPPVPSYTHGGSHNVTSATAATYFPAAVDLVLLMLLLTRRWLGAYFSLGSVGWLWHTSIAGRESPDAWSAGEYEGADKALSGWDAVICKGIGLCRNKFGSAEALDNGEVKERECVGRVPDFIMNYGGLILSSPFQGGYGNADIGK